MLISEIRPYIIDLLSIRWNFVKKKINFFFYRTKPELFFCIEQNRGIKQVPQNYFFSTILNEIAEYKWDLYPNPHENRWTRRKKMVSWIYIPVNFHLDYIHTLRIRIYCHNFMTKKLWLRFLTVRFIK
jgi:hypothetical protein